MRIRISVLPIFWIAPIAFSQPVDTPLRFEVVSVKPYILPPNQISFQVTRPDPGNRSVSGIPDVPALQVQGTRLYRRSTSVQDLILDAYGLWDFQIIELPDWAKSHHDDRYEVDARAAEGSIPTSEDLRSMLRSLLAERFNFKAHRDIRKVPVYSLERSTGVLGMRKLEPDEQPPRYSLDSPTVFGPMDDLAQLPTISMARPVLNHTGLEGIYEYLRLYDSATYRQMSHEDPQGFEALVVAGVHKLGLKLVPKNDDMPVLVVDHVERPLPN
jgi:uncharacterized protein (TIGR03435 family)